MAKVSLRNNASYLLLLLTPEAEVTRSPQGPSSFFGNLRISGFKAPAPDVAAPFGSGAVSRMCLGSSLMSMRELDWVGGRPPSARIVWCLCEEE